eukprot:tig00021745_g23382.t1
MKKAGAYAVYGPTHPGLADRDAGAGCSCERLLGIRRAPAAAGPSSKKRKLNDGDVVKSERRPQGGRRDAENGGEQGSSRGAVAATPRLVQRRPPATALRPGPVVRRLLLEGFGAGPSGPGPAAAAAGASDQIRLAIRPRPVREGDGRPPYVQYDTEKSLFVGSERKDFEGALVRVLAPGDPAVNAPARSRIPVRFLKLERAQEKLEDFLRGELTAILDGHNATVFFYGQSGSGKTHAARELVALACRLLEERMAARDPELRVELRVSAVEVHCETAYDALAPRSGLESASLTSAINRFGTEALRLYHIVPSEPAAIVEAYDAAEGRRRAAGTALNARSSRSHLLFRVEADFGADREAGGAGAGGGAQGAGKEQRQRLAGEGNEIRRDLLNLERVFREEGARRQDGVFRGRTLTHLLMGPLQNGRIAFVACLRPEEEFARSTLDVLKFASNVSGQRFSSSPAALAGPAAAAADAGGEAVAEMAAGCARRRDTASATGRVRSVSRVDFDEAERLARLEALEEAEARADALQAQASALQAQLAAAQEAAERA